MISELVTSDLVIAVIAIIIGFVYFIRSFPELERLKFEEEVYKECSMIEPMDSRFDKCLGCKNRLETLDYDLGVCKVVHQPIKNIPDDVLTRCGHYREEIPSIENPQSSTLTREQEIARFFKERYGEDLVVMWGAVYVGTVPIEAWLTEDVK